MIKNYIVQLQGSEAQIKWGKSIRKNKLLQIALLPDTQRPDDIVYRQVWLRAIPHAYYWIQHRNEQPLDLLNSLDMKPHFHKRVRFQTPGDTLEWAHTLKNFVVLDTETSGLDEISEIVELSVINGNGDVLIDTLIRPHNPIPEQATAIHGITNDMVSTAPTFTQVWPLLYPLLCLYKVVVYNAPYDMSIIKRLSLSERYTSKNIYADCAMRAYASYFQEPGVYENSFRWHKLEVACEHLGIIVDGVSHRSLTDCKSTLAVIRRLRELYDNRLVEIGA